MTSETTSGREPIQIVELVQPRCALFYGSAPCEAELGVTGDRKCFNTRVTCQDPDNIDLSDSIVWRFVRPSARLPRDLFDSTGGVISTNPIPSLVGVSTSPTRINVGGGTDSASPFGRRASLTVTLQDHPWDDSVEDKYIDEREYNPMERGTFWSKWLARNPYHGRFLVRVIEGYVGQDLGDMQTRLYVLERVSGPDGSGRVVLTAKDPLRLADEKRTQFPSVTDGELDDAINDSQTTSIVVLAAAAELEADFGNTGSTRYLRIDNEILRYTGKTGSGAEWTLTGVLRGQLGTAAASHEANAHVQRVGRYESMECWLVANDLLDNHTPLPDDYIDLDQWNTEGNAYLQPFTITGTVAQPTSVLALLAELTEQCLFYLWWDERAQTIPIKAIRPVMEDGFTPIDDEVNIIAGSTAMSEDPSERISRVFLYYGQKDPTRALTEVGNFQSVRVRVDGDAEGEDQYGDIRTRQIFSRWLTTSAQAIQTTLRLLFRFRNPPRYLTVKLDAKDRAITTADVLNVTTRAVVDDTGAEVATKWQVIAFEEVLPGETVRYDLQSFEFQGRFWRWMADDAPDYGDATEEERENGAWFADDDGLMSDGTIGYQWV